MTPEELVQQADALYHDLDLARVKRFREENDGAHAIGHLPIYAPREIVDAAGMLPVGLSGGRGQVEIIRGDAYFQSYICQIPRSTIELALAGKYELLSGFLFPSTCDVIRNLSGMWKVLFPEQVRALHRRAPELRPRRWPGASSAASCGGLRDDLAKLRGKPVTDDELHVSIARYNDNRRAISELFALRSRAPWRALALESYLVLFAGNVLPVEEHTALVAPTSPLRSPPSGPCATMPASSPGAPFASSPPRPDSNPGDGRLLHRVADDCRSGKRWPEPTSRSTEGDPLAAIWPRRSSPTALASAARYEPHGDRARRWCTWCASTHAEGVIFAAPSFCDPALLEQPMLQDAARSRRRCPWTAFKYSENLGQFQVIREQAGTFADSIKLWSDSMSTPKRPRPPRTAR
jgi:benzoyl-CoA reductase subunit C